MDDTPNWKVEVKTPNPSERKFLCKTCERKTSHRILTEVLASESAHDAEAEVHVVNYGHFLTIQCSGCTNVSFCEIIYNTDDYWIDGESGNRDYIKDETLYPKRISNLSLIDGTGHLPDDVEVIYKETYSAIVDHLWILGGAGIRALIEAICKEKLAAGKNLAEKIDSLVTLGLITKDNAEILHNLRFMGNEATHEARAHTIEELTAAMMVVEHLLKTIYIQPKVATKIPKRKT